MTLAVPSQPPCCILAKRILITKLQMQIITDKYTDFTWQLCCILTLAVPIYSLSVDLPLEPALVAGHLESSFNALLLEV